MAKNKTYFQGIGELVNNPELEQLKHKEFPESLPAEAFLGDEIKLSESSTSRRDFLKYVTFCCIMKLHNLSSDYYRFSDRMFRNSYRLAVVTVAVDLTEIMIPHGYDDGVDRDNNHELDLWSSSAWCDGWTTMMIMVIFLLLSMIYPKAI